jgi:hypothetical protein
VGEVIETPGETGKPYHLAARLPILKVSGRPRPQATLFEDGVTMALVLFSLVALFWDGLLHNNIVGTDSFWSGAHIMMYTGLILTGIWLGRTMLRYQDAEPGLDLSAVPRGYGLALISLPLAVLSGPADFIWHSAFGFENQIDSAYSPPHQGLFLAGAMLAAIPAASAWHRRDVAPSMRVHLPALFSITVVVAVGLFVMHQLVPFYAGVSTTAAFQEDIEGRADAFAPGADAVHEEGLSPALTHYGDEAFPYYFFSTHHTVGGIMLFTAILMGGILLMRRRWRVPLGSLTIMCTTLALLFAMLSEYREWELIPGLILAGVVGDLLLARLTGVVGPVPIWRMRLFALLMPIVLWSLFFLCVELLADGLGWEVTLWFGVLVSSAALGYGVSLLVFAPYAGAAVEQVPDAPAAVPEAVR